MNYKDRLPSEEEIMNSLRAYFSTFHTMINAIGELDAEKIQSQSSKGWYLDITGNIQSLISDFVNIYGYIYKNGQVNNWINFSRGTTGAEVQKLRVGHEIGSILSVTDNENIAKRFSTPPNGSLIRLSVKDVPFVYVENLKDRGKDFEEEFLVLPFTEVGYIEFVSDWAGIKYYSMRLDKQELPEIGDDELETLRSEMVNDFSQFDRLSRDYLEALNNYNNKSVSYETRENFSKECIAKKDALDQFRRKFIRMLKGLCRQREKDIDLQREAENRELEARQKAEEKRKNSTTMKEINSRKKTINNNVFATIEQMKQISEHYRAMANRLGIKTFHTENDSVTGVHLDSDQINALLNEQINMNLESALGKYNIANTESYTLITNLINEYDTQSFSEIKARLNDRVKALIEATILNSMHHERSYVEGQKNSILHKILGRNKLKDARLKNIDARLELALAQNDKSNPENSVRVMLYEMYKCAVKYTGGSLSQGMQDLESAIRENFVVTGARLPTSEELMRRAGEEISRQQNNLPDILRKKPKFLRFMHKEQEVARINADTESTIQQTKIIENTSRPVINNGDVSEAYTKIVKKLQDIMKIIYI